MKHILFPTDFSKAANQAFHYALLLADRYDAGITTLHIYQHPGGTGLTHMPITMQRFFEQIQLSEFENYRDAIPPLRELAEEKGFEKIELRHVLKEGRQIVADILEAIDREGADFVVMGTTGARGLKEVFLGSVAGEVLEKATCPVLVVPENALVEKDIRHVAFTTNYEEEDKKALNRVLDLAGAFGATVHCINVDTAHTHFYHKRMDRLREEYAGREEIVFEVLDGNDILKVLTTYFKTHRIDLVAMTTHKRGFLEELFHYSKSKQLSYHSDIPILSFPADIL